MVFLQNRLVMRRDAAPSGEPIAPPCAMGGEGIA